MWCLKKQFSFEASHLLKNHDGKCANLHGHSWKGEIEVEGMELIRGGPKENMLIDYGDLARILDPIVTRLDHQHLNTVLAEEMPTSEFVAMWVYNKLKPYINTTDGKYLKAVTIKETCTSECRYSQ
jgi:6-pyruvoyltetrahydropterin/6-carboxytetrahydropterin synthase